MVLSEGWYKRHIPLERIAEITSTNVARTFGLYHQKGTIRVGSAADFILVDLNKTWEIQSEGLLYRNKWTPYQGMQVHGQIQYTIVRGQTVYENGKITVQPGFGQFVTPNPFH